MDFLSAIASLQNNLVVCFFRLE
uniref:Uncharacterized protein n=1 Tax=Rhizophora mucronata TaxID=61149 RepID=A0A2P2J2G6_RHIMU